MKNCELTNEQASYLFPPGMSVSEGGYISKLLSRLSSS